MRAPTPPPGKEGISPEGAVSAGAQIVEVRVSYISRTTSKSKDGLKSVLIHLQVAPRTVDRAWKSYYFFLPTLARES